MLNYTSQTDSGIVLATYGGSTAYISLPNSEESYYLNVRLSENWSSMWSYDRNLGMADCALPISDTTIRALAHEYTHKYVYALSPTGLILNGIRSTTAHRFLYLSSKKSVRKYYQMRTIHLMETHAYHEAVAHRIDEILARKETDIEAALKEVTNEFMANHILPAEKRIRQQWKKLGIRINPVTEKAAYYWGKRLHQHFTIRQSVHTGSSEFAPIHSTTSENRLLTDHAKMPWHAVPAKNIYRLFTKIAGARASTQRLFEWYWIGQRTQYETLKNLYKMDHDTFRDKILTPNLFFVMEWAGIGVEQHEFIFQLYEDTLTMNQTDFLNLWVPQQEACRNLKSFYEFFYRHGN